MILTAQFLGSLFEPPFALTALDAALLAADIVTGLALGAIVFVLALLLGPGMRL